MTWHNSGLSMRLLLSQANVHSSVNYGGDRVGGRARDEDFACGKVQAPSELANHIAVVRNRPGQIEALYAGPTCKHTPRLAIITRPSLRFNQPALYFPSLGTLAYLNAVTQCGNFTHIFTRGPLSTKTNSRENQPIGSPLRAESGVKTLVPNSHG